MGLIGPALELVVRGLCFVLRTSYLLHFNNFIKPSLMTSQQIYREVVAFWCSAKLF